MTHACETSASTARVFQEKKKTFDSKETTINSLTSGEGCGLSHSVLDAAFSGRAEKLVFTSSRGFERLRSARGGAVLDCALKMRVQKRYSSSDPRPRPRPRRHKTLVARTAKDNGFECTVSSRFVSLHKRY